jgi:transcriptional regulator CtsR
MSKKVINVGRADRGDGDSIRVAFVKVNDNFNELYTIVEQFDNLILNIKLDGSISNLLEIKDGK